MILDQVAARTPVDPVIVMGDFNVGEDNPIIQAFRDAGFRDSFRVANPDAAEAGTFSGFEETLGPDKIDYIWVDLSVEVPSAEIVRDKVNGRWISDHVPIVATLLL